MKRIICSTTYNKEIEITRNNITPREFYWYCNQRARAKGMELEDYIEYREWINPSYPDDSTTIYHDTEDGGKQRVSYTIQPYEFQSFLSGVYNCILEFEYSTDKTGTGYCYIAEQ